jgi:Domain of unknown function (DUF4349)
MVRRRVGTVVAVALLGVLAAVLALAGRGSGSVDPTGTAAPPMSVQEDRPSAPEAGAPIPDAATDDARSAASDPAPSADVVGRDVVRTAQLTLQVADPTAAGRGVRSAIAATGGFVAEEQADTTGTWLVVRVPAAGLDRLVDDLAATGTVLSRSGRVEDATEQVVDLDSRVSTQRASVTRVRALLAQATSIGDVVAVESELARREADLDSLERRLAALRDRVALSTLTVELRGAPLPPPDGPTPGFGVGLGAGWTGLKVVGAALATAAGFLLPFLPVVAVAAAVGWAVWRRRAGWRRGGPGRDGET